MSFDPIQHLLDEHAVILDQFAELEAAVERVRAGGEDALAEALRVFERVGAMMATQLHRHAQKEDEALFPAIEAVIGATAGPTVVMRQEHRAIHDQGVLLRETLYQLDEVEHPQIEAGRDRLRELAASGGSAEALSQTGAEILRLVHMHFQKEEQVLFPMARNLLAEDEMEAVAAKIATIEHA